MMSKNCDTRYYYDVQLGILDGAIFIDIAILLMKICQVEMLILTLRS